MGSIRISNWPRLTVCQYQPNALPKTMKSIIHVIINCFDCIEVCSQSAMKFGYSAKSETQFKRSWCIETQIYDSQLAATGLAAGKIVAEKAIPGQNNRKSRTSDSDYTSRFRVILIICMHCTSCHLCVSKCPSNVIKPAFLEYGLGGMMQPAMDFEKRFLQLRLYRLLRRLPQWHALLPLTMEEKHHNQMGQVKFILKKTVLYLPTEHIAAHAWTLPHRL